MTTSFPGLMTLLGPPQSPDLPMGDYILWGNLKTRVCEHKPHTLDDLKEAIYLEASQIDRALLERLEANF